MTAFEERLGRITALQKLPGSSYKAFRALRPLVFVEDEPVASLPARLLEAPGAVHLAKEDVVHHLMQRAPLLCDAAEAPCLFTDVPGASRLRAICEYVGQLEQKGAGAARPVVLAALQAAQSKPGSRAHTFVQLAQAAAEALS